MNTNDHNASDSKTTAAHQPRHRSKRRRAAIATASLAAFAIVSAGVWYNAQAANTDTPPVTPNVPVVTVAPAEQRVMAELEEFTGRVAATETVDLRPQVSGRISHIGFQAGELVKTGQTLFQIEPRSFQAAVDAAKATVANAQARYDSAQREADRATALLAARAISNEEAETRQSAAAQAKAQLLLAQASLETANIELERTRVVAPISGRISRAYVTTGNLVSGNPSAATLLTTIVATGSAHVYIDIDEATLLAFRQQHAQSGSATRIPAELKLEHEDTYSRVGYIESFDNRIDTTTGSLATRLYFDDPEETLLPGLYAQVRIPLSQPAEKILVSERAIGTDQSQKFVLAVQENGSVAYRAVDLGPSLDGKRIIRAGLGGGERVIVNGLQRVRPGMTVQAIPAPPIGATAVASK